MTGPTPTSGARMSISGLLLAGLMLVAAAIVFVVIYLVLPGNGHFYGLLTIGVVSLFLSVGAYFAEGFSADPTLERAVSWAFAGMGFATLFLTLLLAPNSPFSTTTTLVAVLLLILLLAGGVVAVRWRMGQERSTSRREEQRAEWRSRPAPSAFSYATAHPPGEAGSPTATEPATPPPGAA